MSSGEALFLQIVAYTVNDLINALSLMSASYLINLPAPQKLTSLD